MTQTVLGPKGSPRRRWSVLLALAVAVCFGLFWVAGAQAVHDETFQLDGDVRASTTTNAGGTTQTLDWDSIFTSAGANQSPLPTGFDAAKFDKDFDNNGTSYVNSDTTTFATGSKDTLPISGWQCNKDNNVNNKIDVVNAYAASYTAPGGDEILYFGLERFTNTGTANVGFWFLQASVSCDATNGTQTFSGQHTDGDLLVVSEFTGGGDVSTVNVYRWNGGANGSLGTTPVGSGVDCRNSGTTPDDPECGAANRVAITTPWLTAAFTASPKVGDDLPIAQFFEGGVNLTDEALGGKCFNTFLADTRSSAELGATLFDFSGGTLGQCTSETITTPKENDGTTTISSKEIPTSGTLLVKDSAVVNVAGASSFSGTVSFHLCGPNATQTLCSSGGVAVGAAKPVTSSGQTVVSDSATITAVGHYCWRAVFSGDTALGVPGSSDARASECFQITPRTPTLSTTAVNAAGTAISAPVSLGTAIYDTATLGNTANKKGSNGPAGSTDGSINPTTAGGANTGKIVFKLYGPSPDNSPTENECNTLAATFPAAGIEVATSGNNTFGGAGSSPPVTFTPQSPGFYFWKAVYTSDDANTNGTSHNSDCLASSERVEVLQLQPAIATAQSFVPNDSATISVAAGAGDLQGTVVFKMWVDDATCSGASDYETPAATPINIASGSGTGISRTVVSGNTTSYAVNGTTFHWVVEYTNTNPGHKNVTSPCGKEHSSITIQNNGTPNP